MLIHTCMHIYIYIYIYIYREREREREMCVLLFAVHYMVYVLFVQPVPRHGSPVRDVLRSVDSTFPGNSPWT